MTIRGRRSRAIGLSARLALASLGTAIAIGVVCAVGLSSLENTAAVTRVAVTQQLALIDDAAAMSAFQYQKGFVAEYLLSGNRELARRARDQPPRLRVLVGRQRTRRSQIRRRRSCSTTSSANTPPTIGRERRRSRSMTPGKVDEARADAGRQPRAFAAPARPVPRVRPGQRGRTPSARSQTPSAASAGWRTCWWAPASRARSPACSPVSCGRAGSRSRSTSLKYRSSRQRSVRAFRSRLAAPVSKHWASRSAPWSRSSKRPTRRSPSTGDA